MGQVYSNLYQSSFLSFFCLWSGHPVTVSCHQVFISLVLDLEGADSVQLVMFGDGYEADVILCICGPVAKTCYPE